MGLDISVYRLLNRVPKDKYKRDNNYFRLVDDYGNYDNRGFPEWTKKLERTKTESWYDWDAFKEQTGINIDDYITYLEHYCGKDSYLQIYPNTIEDPADDAPDEVVEKWREEVEKQLIKIYFRDVPRKKVKVKVIYREEEGYQRKGLNINFYKEHEADCGDYIAWTKAELEHILDTGCDEDHPSEYDRHYICTPKADFREHIIDNFEEGQCCVWFNW